jgi:adenylate cyclase
MSFFDELKRRNVIRVGVAYMVASWLLLQIVDVLVPILDLPLSVGKFIFLILVIGLLPALIFSWAYEMTPEGLKRDSEVVTDPATSHHTSRRLNRLTIVLVLIVAGIVVLDRVLPTDGNQAIPAAVPSPSTDTVELLADVEDKRQSVAVMPFVNMSDDEANEYFSDGISEELLNVLVKIESLRVPSRTSSFTYKGGDKKLSEIGRELNVDHVLEGSVRKAGNSIRVTAQLIEASTDTHLWSETYTRELENIFAVQEEIANAIANALQLELSGTDRQGMSAHSTSNIEAYNKYLLGRYLWLQRTPDSLQLAAKHLRDAVVMDPDYYQAWAALADTYLTIPDYFAGTAVEYVPLARAALRTALEINPNSIEALGASGNLKAGHDFDWEGAERDFLRALAISPGNANVHQWYGEMLNQKGRLDEALEQLRLARQADPMSKVIRHVPGFFLLWALRFDEAQVHYKDVLELGDPFRWTMQNLDILNTLRGDYDEARRWAIQLAELEGFDPAADLARIDAVENPELKEHALELLRQRQDLDDGVFGKSLQYAVLGEFESALESLEKAYQADDGYSSSMGYMRIYDPLRENPRFQAMLKEMNLWP